MFRENLDPQDPTNWYCSFFFFFSNSRFYFRGIHLLKVLHILSPFSDLNYFAIHVGCIGLRAIDKLCLIPFSRQQHKTEGDRRWFPFGIERDLLKIYFSQGHLAAKWLDWDFDCISVFWYINQLTLKYNNTSQDIRKAVDTFDYIEICLLHNNSN